MSGNDEHDVVLMGLWVCPYVMRAKIALAEKGIEFENREEDLARGKKSELLHKYNPIYKKVPVLLHNGKAICESLVILNYIEEAWPNPSLLPPCPYERAQTRFWVDFIDKKLFEVGAKIWKSRGEAQQALVKEFLEVLKVIEGILGEKDYLGGESFGYLDIVAAPLTSWFYAYEQCAWFKVEDDCPKISAWVKRCWTRESIASTCPDPLQVYDFVCLVKKKLGIK